MDAKEPPDTPERIRVQRLRRRRQVAVGGIAATLLLILAAGAIRQIGDRNNAAGLAGDGGSINVPSIVIPVASAHDFDPHGDGTENPDQVELAWDGDLSSAWTTSTYVIPFHQLGKPGVGLLFDLGHEVDVARVDVIHESPEATIQLRSSPSPGRSERDYDVVASGKTGDGTMAMTPVRHSGRYWLVWITRLPPEEEANVSINEVRFIASDDKASIHHGDDEQAISAVWEASAISADASNRKI